MKQDKKWFDQLQDMGCIVCYNEGHPELPRISIIYTRIVGGWIIFIASLYVTIIIEKDLKMIDGYRHRKKFEKRYGDEWELFKQVKALSVYNLLKW